MGKFEDLTGNTYGRLTVISRAPNDGNGKVCWRCRCICGQEKVIRGASLKRGLTKSCSCLNHEPPSNKTHGKSGEPIYYVWFEIKQRCTNPKHPRYKDYGGRGIKLFEEWLEFQPFYDYVSQLPHFNEEGYSLDRIDNDGNYEPDNVRWATPTEQNHNKRNNIFVEYEGKPICLKDAAKLSGIYYGTLLHRYHAGKRGDELFKK